jgi:predicted GNAT family acetyltransferase
MELARFLELHLAALEANEARHNRMLATLTGNLGDQFLAWTLGAPGQCAIRTSEQGAIIIADANERQCHRLAELIAPLNYRVVEGPDQTATWFSQRAAELGTAFADPRPHRIHALSERPVYPGVPGQARLAVVEDTDICIAWVMEFAAEAIPDDPPPPRSAVERDLREARVLFWLVDEEPVSMATIVRRTRRTAAISLVYTPPKLRGRGYAGAVTAALAERIFAEGRTTACLYTDVRNPISNRCYAKIGFRPVCDAYVYRKLLT